MSISQLAPDWLHASEQPIRSQVSKLTQFLTLTTTHKFRLQEEEEEEKEKETPPQAKEAPKNPLLDNLQDFSTNFYLVSSGRPCCVSSFERYMLYLYHKDVKTEGRYT